MKRRQLLFTILKGIAVGIVTGRLAPAQEDLFSKSSWCVSGIIFTGSRFVRVIEGRVPAGGYEPKHRHPNNVMVYLADFDDFGKNGECAAHTTRNDRHPVVTVP